MFVPEDKDCTASRDTRNIKDILGHSDALQLLDLIYDAVGTDSAPSYTAVVNKLRHLVDFEFAISGLGFLDDSKKRHTYIPFNVNYPDEWMKIYDPYKDPIVLENLATYKVQYWADTYKKYSPDKKFILNAEDVGLKTGYTNGARNQEGTRGSIFTISGRNIKRDLRTEVILHYLTPHMHNCMLRLSGSKQTLSTKITPRERDILKWFKEGKSIWDVSLLLNISENTVKFHCKNIFSKLDTVNRAQAVAVALSEGLID